MSSKAINTLLKQMGVSFLKEKSHEEIHDIFQSLKNSSDKAKAERDELKIELERFEWIKTEQQKPKFGELVLVYCKIYGRFLATYEELDNTGFGNWKDMQGNLGILPPIYWMNIPDVPNVNPQKPH